MNNYPFYPQSDHTSVSPDIKNDLISQNEKIMENQKREIRVLKMLLYAILIVGLLLIIAILLKPSQKASPLTTNKPLIVSDSTSTTTDKSNDTNNLPSEVDSQVFNFTDLGVSVELPIRLMKNINLVEVDTSGEIGLQRCWYLEGKTSQLVKSVNAGGGPCGQLDAVLWFGSNSTDYDAGRSGGFSDYT